MCCKKNNRYTNSSLLIFLLLYTVSYANTIFKVVSTFPKHNSTNVEFNTNIIVEVNHPLLRKSLVPDNIFVNGKPLSEVYPEIKRIPQLDNYKFVLPIMLEYGKTYTIHLSSYIMDDYNNHLEPYTFTFSVVNKEPLKVISAKYEIKENFVLATIKLNHNVFLSPTDVEVYYKKNLISQQVEIEKESFTNPTDEIKLKIPLQDDNKNFIDNYTIIISTKLLTLNGDNLKKPFIWKLRSKE